MGKLYGTYFAARAAIPHLIAGGRGGSIILTSSTTGLRGFADYHGGGVGYAASKHGIVGIMRCLANGLAMHSIRVNTIHPTGVNTPMATNDEIASWIEKDPSRGEYLQNPLPIPMLEPADVSATVVFLASDDAKYITGVALPVDAGFCNRP